MQLGGRQRQPAPVVTPVLDHRTQVASRGRTAGGESSDSSDCPGSNTQWGSVSAGDSARTLDEVSVMRRHSVSARPSELKSLLELTHNRDQELQLQTQALQVGIALNDKHGALNAPVPRCIVCRRCRCWYNLVVSLVTIRLICEQCNMRAPGRLGGVGQTLPCDQVK